MKQTPPEYDVIVAGSGPGGATVARELSRRGKKVLVLEWGGNAPVRGTAAQFVAQAGLPGRGLLVTKELVGVVRGITTGGSSVFYYATAFEPPLAMLKARGMDVAREVDEVRQELPVKSLADHLVGPMAKRIMASARDLGHDWKPLPKFVFQDRCRPDCWRCTYGCPFGAKWNARMFIEEAVTSGASLVTGAKVLRVLTEGDRAVGVEYRRRGSIRQARARQVVVSAGGIGSPMILRASGIEDAGHDWFFDPMIVAMGTVPDVEGGKEFPMAAGMHFEGEGFVMADMAVPLALHRMFNAEVFRLGQWTSHRKTLSIMVKIKDDLGGELTGRGAVRKTLTPADREKFRRGFAIAERILKNAGARDVWKSWYLASHPGGTVKVGDQLDANLQTRFRNLHVCDCSVIPEAWGLPPTFTILALGKRLAKHLAATA